MIQATLIRKQGKWRVRWREVDAEGVLRHRSQQLATVADYPRKTELRPLFNEFVAKLNRTAEQPLAQSRLVDFIEHNYLPYTERTLKPSTTHDYPNIFKRYLKDVLGDVLVREFSVPDGERIMQAVATNHDKLSTKTYGKIKHFLGGVFTYAIRIGAYPGNANPMHLVERPKGKASVETVPAGLNTATRIIAALPFPARAAVAIAAYTGVRKGEVRGLQWDDIGESEIAVRRSVWRGFITEPKTESSAATVPIAPELKVILDDYRRRRKNGSLWLFPGRTAALPADWDAIVRRHIQPALKDTGLTWPGLKAMRTGVASECHAAGVPTPDIQRLLRHADGRTTEQHYVKLLPGAVRQAIAARSLWVVPQMCPSEPSESQSN